ncbi:MAG TPA: PIN domain-containing protein [Terriglobales bacterium]|jgi:uncharacterized protein|nr:PIN domain-containing protein [Terriglobales bacterium]
MRRVLVDTGPIVALLSRRDQYHKVCVEALKEIPGPLFTCWPVLTEAAWLLGQGGRASEHLQQLIRSIDSGFISLLPLSSEDALPIGVILKKYRDIRIQLADAALVHLAARDGMDTVFTLDRRDFSVYRLPKGRTFRVLPESR